MSKEELLSEPTPPDLPDPYQRYNNIFGWRESREQISSSEAIDQIHSTLVKALEEHPEASLTFCMEGNSLIIYIGPSTQEIESYNKAHKEYNKLKAKWDKSPTKRKKTLEDELRQLKSKEEELCKELGRLSGSKTKTKQDTESKIDLLF